MPRKDLLNTGKLIRYGHLKPWMLAYAEWRTSEVGIPSMNERRAKLASMIKMPVCRTHIEELENRKDYQKYVEAILKGPMEQARAKFLAKLPKYIDAHERALDQAIEAGDYKAVSAFTVPVLDRVAPKKQEGGTAVQVNVTLSSERMAGFTEAYTEAEVEALPAPESSDSTP